MERLAFTGLRAGVRTLPGGADLVDSRTGPIGRAEPERDSLAFQGLLAFIVVLFFRPQDSLPFLEPLHLAEVTGTFAVIALVAERLTRGAPVSRITTELVLLLGVAGVMIVTAPFSIWPGGAISVVTDLYCKVIVVFTLMLNTLTSRERFARLVTVVGTGHVLHWSASRP